MKSSATASVLATRRHAPESRRERRRRELSAHIYECARELFQEQGFIATTVEQIAERADIAPATFFNHFGTKSRVLAMMASEVTEYTGQLVEEHLAGEGTIGSRLRALVEDASTQIIETAGTARDVLLEVVRSQARPEDMAPYLGRVHEPLRAALERGQQDGEIRHDEDSTFLAEMVIGTINIVLTNWLADPNYPIADRLPRAAAFAYDAIAIGPKDKRGE